MSASNTRSLGHLPLLLLSGPPFGPELYRGVLRRLGRGEARSVLDPSAPGDGWQERAAALVPELRRRPTVLVAHGLAVPVAVAAAAQASPAALILSNGPLRHLDPITAGLARICATRAGARVLAGGALRPEVWLPWLASSAGLRRAVVNPYVMDRDTVAALCGPLVENAEGRRAMAAYLGSLLTLPALDAVRCPVLLLWGDGDPLYPQREAAFFEASVPGAQHRAVPGGQHLHPEERPWEMADRMDAWLSDQGSAG